MVSGGTDTVSGTVWSVVGLILVSSGTDIVSGTVWSVVGLILCQVRCGQ